MNPQTKESKPKNLTVKILIITLAIALVATAVCLAFNLESAMVKKSQLKEDIKTKYDKYTNGSLLYFDPKCGCGDTTMLKFSRTHPDEDSFIEHYVKANNIDPEELEGEWTINAKKINVLSFAPIATWIGVVSIIVIVMLFIKISQTYSLNSIFDVFLALTLIICGGILIYAAIEDISYVAKDISEETFASSAYAELENATEQVASNVEMLGKLIEDIVFYLFTLGGSIMIVCGLRKLANLWFNLNKR